MTGNSALHVAALADSLVARGHECIVAVPRAAESIRFHPGARFRCVDFAACATYKWLMGDFGLGFLYARRGVLDALPLADFGYYAFSAPGAPPGIGLSLVTFMGYSGMLFAPSMIGLIATRTGLAVIFLSIPVLYVLVLALSHHAVNADLGD